MRGVSFVLPVLGALFAAAEFTEPISSKGDFSQTYKVGEEIEIAWNAGWDWGKGAQPDVADLFVMWFDDPKEFSQLVLANVSLAKSGNYTWRVDVANDKVAQEPKFVFRFSQHTSPEVFDWDLPKMPSRGFMLSEKAGKSSATATKTGISGSSTSTAVSPKEDTTVSKADTSPSPTGTQATTGKKSHTVAIAAGVLGGLVAIALLLGGVLFLLRQARKRREAGIEAGKSEAGDDRERVYGFAHQGQELAGVPPSGLAGDGRGQSRELNGSTPRDWH